MKITPSDSAYQRTLLYKFQDPIYKNVEFCIFLPEDKSRMRVYLFVCFVFFFQGWLYRHNGPRILWEGSFERKWKVLVPFLSDQKNRRAPRPPPTLIFSQSSRNNILR